MVELVVEYLLGGRAVRVDIGAVEFAIAGLGFTRTAAAEQCEVSDRTLRRFLNGRRVSARTMNRILSGLYLDASDVIVYLKPGGK